MGAMILTMASDWRPFRATSLLFWRSIAARGGGKCLAICEQGRASNPVLFDENRKTVTVNRLDHIIGRAQFKSHGFIVNDRYHNHRDGIQVRFRLQGDGRRIVGLLCLRAFGYLCRDFGRKIYGKDGTLTRLTLDGNSALHQSDVPVTDGESQACPSVLPGYGDIRLGKLLK